MSKEEIIDVIHKTMYQFFDVCGDNEEVPMTDKDELLLSVNKAICNNIKALKQEPFMNKPCISVGVCEHDKMQVLDKIRAEIEEIKPNNPNFKGYFEQNVALNKVLQIIDKYRNGDIK